MALQQDQALGKYRLIKPLGSGGMADVYLAEDTQMGREVALKVLPPEFSRHGDNVARFQKEVQAAAKLSHAHVVTVYDVGAAEIGGLTYHYYAMQLLPGGDLKSRIIEGLSEQQALGIAIEIAKGLGFAHRHGIVHRDIKPENVLFDSSGHAVLTDLGIAKAIGSGTKMTQTGMSIGTPHYMSPEQARGQAVDGRSDLYSLGVVLYEMLTGQAPYQAADTFAVALSHVNDPIPQLPSTLSQYQGLIDSLMAKQPEERFANAEALITTIEQLQQGGSYKAPAKTRVLPKVETSVTATSKNSTLYWLLGGSGAAALLAVGLYISGVFDTATTPRSVATGTVSTPKPLATVQAILNISSKPVEQLIGKLVSIPAGSFTMGCSTGDSECYSDEKPTHRVTVKAFKLMETVVTFAMWDACVADGGCSHRPGDEGWGRGNRPVINVSYNDITQQYIPWPNRKTGQTFRLPSEAEWEYAARAGSSTKYSWENELGRNNANCDGCGSQWDNKQTAPVKSFRPNNFGLYDMHGNVWEWTADCWNSSYSGAPTNGSAWQSGDCGQRVLRGGSWYFGPWLLRVSYRFRGSTANRSSGLGFRLGQDIK